MYLFTCVLMKIIMQDSDCEVVQEVEVYEDTLCNNYEGMELLVLFAGPLLPVTTIQKKD